MGKLRRLFHLRMWGPELEEGIDWELQHHVEERMDELREAGLAEDAARREAMRSLGDGAKLRSELRRIDRGRRRSGRLVEFVTTVRQDLRYGARGLLRNAGFSAAVVLTLALGIGANGALFSVADALLLRPLPFAKPEELVQLFRTTPQATAGQPYLAPAFAREWLRQQESFTAAFMHWRSGATYTGGAEPVELPGAAVTHEFTETLGVPPLAGRSFTRADMAVGAQPVVLVSHGFWTRELGGDAGAIGRDIVLDDVAHTVIGIMPRGFKYPEYHSSDIWLPLHDDDRQRDRRVPYVEVTGRISGAFAAAEQRAAALGSALYRQETPDSEASLRFRRAGELRASNEELTQAMKLLTGAVVLILLIAGVNMVNLLLLRGAARTREIAVRLALGAARSRLVRQLATEAMLLALLSGAVAVLMAFGALRLLMGIMPSSITFYAPHAIAVEGRTLLFTFVVAVLSGLVFGLLPALRATRLSGTAAAGGLTLHASSSRPAGSATLRRALVTSEVALSVTLLIAAGLLISSFVRLARVDPGVELDRLAVLDIRLSARDYADPESRLAYVQLLQDRIGRIPGVQATALTGGLPPRGASLRFGVVLEAEGQEPRPYDGMVPSTMADPDFFAVTGARLLAGRPFDTADDAAGGNVIIGRQLAEHLWPGANAVGRRFRLGEQDAWLTVVGVAADLRLMGPDDRRAPFVIIHPLDSEDVTRAVLAIRTAADPRAVLQPVRAVVHAVNPRQVITELDAASAVYAGAMDMQRFLYVVITSLGALALGLAAVGLYGLLAYGVARRQRELGVRLALGARSLHLQRLIVGEALWLTLVGAVIGGAGALAATRFIEATLYRVEPTDPVTFAAVGAVIFGTAAAAALLPARRAARVEPAVVLRSD